MVQTAPAPASGTMRHHDHHLLEIPRCSRWPEPDRSFTMKCNPLRTRGFGPVTIRVADPRDFGAPLLQARGAPMADAASSPSAAAAALRCRNDACGATAARAAGAASASLASRASSHVPSSHDCCRSRCASVDVLAGIACAPAGWSCAGTFASSALSATGASGLFRSLLLQSRCFGGRDLRHGFAPTASSPFGAAPAESWA